MVSWTLLHIYVPMGECGDAGIVGSALLADLGEEIRGGAGMRQIQE